MTYTPGLRVLVCGSRDFSDWPFLFDRLDELHGNTPIGVVIEGEAPGADTLAKRWALSRGVDHKPFPANWNRHGRAAGPIRNKQMLEEGKPELVIAFICKPLTASRGTKNMVDQATKAGVEVRVESNVQTRTVGG